MQEYSKKLSKCLCGQKPKLVKKEPYRKYECKKCNLQTFFSMSELTARELFNAQIANIDKLKVKI